MKTVALFLFLMLFVNSCQSAKPDSWVVQSPAVDLVQEPVSVEIPSGYLQAGPLCLTSPAGVVPAQVEPVDHQVSRLWWVVSQPAGEAVRYELAPEARCGTVRFEWSRRVSEPSDRLMFGSRPVVQYEYPVFDLEYIEHTKKPFHHVYDPQTGELITKGPGGLYSHHRGIFLGYYAFVNDPERQTRVDIWHAARGERSEHQEFLEFYEGPVMGGHRMAIDWRDHDGDLFVEEVRDFRVFKQEGDQWLIDVQSTLTAVEEHVILGGDRQHAGLQFRASQYVADNRDLSRFIRPSGWEDLPEASEIGEERNLDWPWNAFYFEIEGRPFIVAYLSHPDNPQGAQMSERLYGRFGEYIPYELRRGESLTLTYRFWVAAGENLPGRDQIQRRYEALSHPPSVTER